MDFDDLERLRRRRAQRAPIGSAPSLGAFQTEARAARPQTPRQAAPRDRAVSLAGDALAVLVAAVVILAPFYRGGNRPEVWGCAALVLGAGLALWQHMIHRQHPPARAPLAGMGAGPWIALVMPLYAAVQMLPFGGIEAGLPSGLTTATISLSADATRLGLVRILSAALVFFSAVAVAASPRRARLLAWALFGGALMHAGMAMAGSEGGAATGGFANHNSFAAFAGMGLILGLSLMLGSASIETGGPVVHALERVLLWFALIVVLVALVASQSRLGVFAAFVGGGVMLALHRPPRGRSVLLGGAAAAVAFGLAGGGLLERAALLGPDAEVRLELYRQILGMIAARPLTGWGLDCFPLAFELFHRPPVSSGLVWDHAHNSYLALWSEMGLIAGSAPLLGMIFVVARLWAKARGGARPDPLVAAALGLVAAEAVHGLGDFSLEIAGNLYFFVAVLALGLAQGRHTRPAAAKEPAPT